MCADSSTTSARDHYGTTTSCPAPASTRSDSSHRSQPAGALLAITTGRYPGIADELTSRHANPEDLIDLRNHPDMRTAPQLPPNSGCCDHCKNPGFALGHRASRFSVGLRNAGSTLHVPVPRGCVQLLLQHFRCHLTAWPGGVFRARGGVGLDVCRSVALIAPAFGERADVVSVVSDRVEELGHRLLGRLVVAGDGEHGALGISRWARQRGEVAYEDVVERLDHMRLREMLLQQLTDRRRLVVQLRNVPVALRVVVVGVDDYLSAQRLDRHLAVGLERHRHYDDVARSGGFGRSGRSCPGSELIHQTGQGLWAATVAEHHVVACIDREPGDGAADASTADRSDGRHLRRKLCTGRPIPGSSSVGPYSPQRTE